MSRIAQLLEASARMSAQQPIPLFRPQVTAARKQQLHGDISLAVPMSWHVIGYLLFIVVAAALVFFAIAPYARVETVGGSLVVDRGTVAIVATRAGVVAELAAEEGRPVKAGDLLAKVRSEENLTSGGTAPQKALASLVEQDRQLAEQAAMIHEAGRAEQLRLAAAITGARAEINSLDEQIAGQLQLVSLATHQLTEVKDLAAKGFISRRDLEGQETTLLARRQELARLQQQRAAKSTGSAEATRTMAHLGSSAQAESVAVQAQRTALVQQMAQLDAAKGYALASPIDGHVTALTARLGQTAAAGQELMIVVPSGGRIEAELYVPTSAAGFLEESQEVRLAIDAFPYQQFGTVQARIATIAAAPVLKKTGEGNAVPVYIVTAELTQASIPAFGGQQPLLPGMTLTARIITRKQSLLEWLFEPLFAVVRR